MTIIRHNDNDNENENENDSGGDSDNGGMGWDGMGAREKTRTPMRCFRGGKERKDGVVEM